MKSKFFSLLFLIFSVAVARSQNKIVTGKVTSDAGEMLSGVTVSLKGTQKATATNSSGEYSISVPSAGNEVLIFSFVGKDSKEITVGDRSTINVSLTNSISTLNDVVVIGYGTVKRKDLTGAVASVSGKEIATAPVANVAQAMQGKLPGVSIVSQDGRPGADVAIRVRGGGSISQSNQPLILIDGVPGTLSDIPADQVQSIDVLKDASSTAIYGSRGANGVVLVTTKGAKAGKTTVSLNSYVKFNTPTKYLKALDPYDYLKYVWANADANGSAFQTPFEQLYGLGANTGNNTGGIDSYKNLTSDDIQKQVYNNSTSWNHGMTLTGGTDKTKILFSADYIDDEGMKINSYFKRANVAFKLAQKVFDN